MTYGSNPAGRYVAVDDIQLYIEEYGAGDPVLVVHGNGGSIETMDTVIPALAQHFRVIAVDSRAQGRSFDSDAELTYARMAQDLSLLITALNLGSVHVFGWSDGGNVALDLAFAHPEQVRRVAASGTNYSTVGYLETAAPLHLADDDPLKKVNLAFADRYHDANERLCQQPERLPVIRKKLADLMLNYPNFTREQLATIQTPFLLISGDHDLIRLEHTVELFRQLAHVQLFIVPGADHGPALLYPELVNPVVLKFFQSTYERW